MLKNLTFVLAAVMILATAGELVAQEPAPKPSPTPEKGDDNPAPPTDQRSRGARLIERFDENGDGKLSLAEIPEMMAERLSSADRDGDGFITAAEFDSNSRRGRDGRDGREGREGRRGRGGDGADGADERGRRGEDGGRRGRRMLDPAQALERYDANDDGKLSRDELPERLAERMMEADTDKDGFLTAEELKKAEAKRREDSAKRTLERFDENQDGQLVLTEIPERMRARYKNMDTDQNGILTLKELAAPPVRRGQDRSDRAPAAIIRRLDANEDGKLTGDEIPTWMQRRMEQLDKNKDGALTADELSGNRRRGGRERPAPEKEKGPIF